MVSKKDPKQDSTPTEDRSLSFGGEEPIEIPIKEIDDSPCMVACPAGVNVKSYVTLIGAGLFKEALEVVRQRNPLPGICGRVCTHPCEESCNRGKFEAPVAIRDLKRFIADWEIAHPEEAKPDVPERKFEEKIAIVGAGPAGLTAANDLARRGYGVTIFEAFNRAGGMMVAGIPPFRLPRKIIETEVQAILDLGVELRTNTRIGVDITLQDLREKEGFSAVFMAVGAHLGRKLGIPGEEACLDAVAFLREANLEDGKKPGDSVAVVGGGNSAIDAARMSLRLGSDDVKIVYRRTRQEMPADEGEIEEALEEQIPIDYLISPIEVVLENGKTVGLKVIKNRLGEPDASGRRRPEPIEGSEYVVPCDVVIAAISQSPDLSFLDEGDGFEVTRWSTFVADEETLATNVAGVFAGGDAYTGPASVIDAMRDGHRAALGIHTWLRGEEMPEAEPRFARPGDTKIMRVPEEVEPDARRHLQHREPTHRMRSFDEVAQGFSEEEAIAEATRCLHCGPCSECMICVSTCDQKVFITTDAEGNEEFLRLPMNSAAYAKAKANLPALLKKKAAEESKESADPLDLVPVTCVVVEELCRGCGECVNVCEYHAPKLEENALGRLISNIDEEICRGCGTCTTVCPSDAIVTRHFTDEWVQRRLKEALLST